MPSSTRDSSSWEDGSDVVAIVGIACRLPGDVHDAASFWDLLRSGRSGKCKTPLSRFNEENFHQPNGIEGSGGLNHQGGYYLNAEDIRHFDNAFFQVSNAEAAAMDPQQRNLLEVVYECLESAGIPMTDVAGSDVGCFAAGFAYDFQLMQMKDPEYLTRYSATGMGLTMLANRISHVFDLRGPSLTVDTACSSSLYSLRQACSALMGGECSAAIVAGANLIQSVEQSLGLMKAGVLSKSSSCNTFSEHADGYARADGVAALFLKPLSRALRDNDPIRAVIRGVAVGSNGRTLGISAPNTNAQEDLIVKAYRNAHITAEDIDYLECHGTGTQAGDAAEISALARVFKRTKSNPLYVGSVKTNLGHSEAVSGLSGIIKAVLALENSTIPPSLIRGAFSTEVSLVTPGISVVHGDSIPWPRIKSSMKRPKRAGVNSFGYGGANGHAILEAAPSHTGPLYSHNADFVDGKRSFLLPVSATSTPTLRRRVSDLCSWHNDGSLPDLAYTLSCRRTHFSARGFFVSKFSSDAVSLKSVDFKTVPDLKFRSSPQRIAFVFTGQGAQWAGMGTELIMECDVFRESIKHMDMVLKALPEIAHFSLEDTIASGNLSKDINEARIAQPTTTALQVALVDLLRSWNIKPSVVVGHSSGEIAAAYCAGYITAADAIVSAYYRGLLNHENKIKGAMLAVGLSQADSAQEIDRLNLSSMARVACVNSPVSTTLSGDEEAINMLMTELNRRGIFARKLKTGGKAYHSHHMRPLGERLEALIAASKAKLPPSTFATETRCQYISSVTGKLKTEGFNATYWRQNMESPVLFLQAVSAIMGLADYHYVEIGPHSALSLPLTQIRSTLSIGGERAPYSTALVRDRDCMESALTLAGNLFVHGFDLSFQDINSSENARRPRPLTTIPRYPWKHEEILWQEPRSSTEFRQRKHPHHELLGSLMPGHDEISLTWRNQLNVKHVQWLYGHQLEKTIVFPAAAYLAMVIEACLQLAQDENKLLKAVKIQGFSLLKAMTLKSQKSPSLELFTRLDSGDSTDRDGWYSFRISSLIQKASTIHASGKAKIELIEDRARPVSTSPLEISKTSNGTVWYEKFNGIGMNFSSQFRSINYVRTDYMASQPISRASIQFAKTCSANQSKGNSYPVHPITLDAMLQNCLIASTCGNKDRLVGSVPTYIESATLNMSNIPHHRSESSVLSAVQSNSPSEISASSELYTRDGKTCVHMCGVEMKALPFATQDLSMITRQPFTKISWDPVSALNNENLPASSFSSDVILLVPDDMDSPVGRLVEHLQSDLGPLCQVLSLSEVSDLTLPKGADLICLYELQRGLTVQSMNNDLMQQLAHIFERSSRIIWMTCGGLLHGENPTHALFVGASKALRTEYPSLRLSTLDIQHAEIDDLRTSKNITALLGPLSKHPADEYRQSRGSLYTSRIVKDKNLNDHFIQMEGRLKAMKAIKDVNDCVLQIPPGGTLANAFFAQSEELRGLKAGHLRIRLSVAGFNGETRETTQNHNICGCAGTVLECSDDINKTIAGNAVLAVGPYPLQLTQDVPQWACIELGAWDNLNLLTALLPSFSQAWYALRIRANVLEGESVLITDGASVLGRAAIQVAGILGGKIRAVVATKDDANMLQDHYRLTTDDILIDGDGQIGTNGEHSNGSLTCSQVVYQTSDKHGDISSSLCGNFGRLLQQSSARQLCTPVTMQTLLSKGISVSVVDMLHLYNDTSDASRALYHDTLRHVMSLISRGQIRPIHGMRTYDISSLGKAAEQLSSSPSPSPISISLDNPNSEIQFQAAPEITSFSAHKSYLLIGGLGGLGRNITTWMLSRGARHFTYLCRTDQSRSPNSLVSDLRKLQGVTLDVVCGSVVNLADVQKAIAVASKNRLLGGIMHAAMEPTNERLFNGMSTEAFNRCIEIKVAGAQNILTSLVPPIASSSESTRSSATLVNGEPVAKSLDFILFLSSTLGSIGIPAHSGYCAANAFLDSFALHLQKRHNLPAISVGLSRVVDAGYLQKNPDAGTRLARTRIAPLSVGDVTRILDIALRSIHRTHHILTGLDVGWQRMECESLDKWQSFPSASDPRLTDLIEELKDPEPAATVERAEVGRPISAVSNTKTDASTAKTKDEPVDMGIRKLVTQQLQFSSTDALDVDTPLSSYGLDSMAATELRSEFHSRYKVDVPLFELTGANFSTLSLIQKVSTETLRQNP